MFFLKRCQFYNRIRILSGLKQYILRFLSPGLRQKMIGNKILATEETSNMGNLLYTIKP
jgi:hypothetical protein